MNTIKCPNIDKIKELIIPTKEWLEPLENLIIENDIHTKGKLYIANLLKKGQIIVKITKENPKKIIINNNLYGYPNIVNIYCTFKCNDDLLMINKNKQFCNNTKNSKKYTLELMEKYAKSLTARKMSFEIYKDALLQLIFAQFNIFSKFGYTHNDIHSGNILTQVTKNTKIFKYKYFYPTYFKSDKISIECESTIEFILADLDDIETIDEKYLKNKEYEDINSVSLYDNIKATINTLNNSIKNKQDKEKLKEIYNEYYSKIDEKMYDEHIKIVKKYMDDEKKYRGKTIKLIEKFVYDYYNIINDAFKL